MRKFHSLLLSMALLVIGQAHAQTKQVTGLVIDSLGAPVPGASVVVRNSSVGTRTDDKGSFVIQVPQNNLHLIISAIGFNEQQVNVTNQDNVRVILGTTKTAMQEVIVTAL